MDFSEAFMGNQLRINRYCIFFQLQLNMKWIIIFFKLLCCFKCFDSIQNEVIQVNKCQWFWQHVAYKFIFEVVEIIKQYFMKKESEDGEKYFRKEKDRPIWIDLEIE
ncbi:hypothetical protein ABPG74_001235 [Tetrahymena malaccensis]